LKRRIAIATDNEKTISSHFGRTRGFLIVDIEDNDIQKVEYRENNFTRHTRAIQGSSRGDTQSAVSDALADCEALISGGMGQRIYSYLSQTNIKPYITSEINIEKAIQLYINQVLIDESDKMCNH